MSLPESVMQAFIMFIAQKEQQLQFEDQEK